MLLFILGVVTFPTAWIVQKIFPGVSEDVIMLLDGVERLAFTVMMLKFSHDFGFRQIPPKTHVIGLLALLPALVIAVDNFPFASLIAGQITPVYNMFRWVAFAVYCAGVGIFEEVSYRGIILPLCLIKFKDKKHPVVKAVVASSVVFSLSHLVNLFGGNIGGTFFQVGYTLLIGAMCGVVAVRTGNVGLAALVHAVYNFGGLFVEKGCGTGTVWPPVQIAVTAVVGTVFGVWVLVMGLLADRTPASAFSLIGDGPTEFTDPPSAPSVTPTDTPADTSVDTSDASADTSDDTSADNAGDGKDDGGGTSA